MSAHRRWSPFRGADPALLLVAAVANVALVVTEYVAYRAENARVYRDERVEVVDVDLGRPRLSEQAARAYHVLQLESVFAGAHIGMAGMPSQQATAMLVLMRKSERREAFQWLSQTARTPAGRLYGLLGLRLTDSVAYANAHIGFAYDQTRVEIVFGCIQSTLTVAALVEMIDSGALVRDFTESIPPPPETALPVP